jgi:hypothetical protein
MIPVCLLTHVVTSKYSVHSKNVIARIIRTRGTYDKQPSPEQRPQNLVSDRARRAQLRAEHWL